MGLFDKAAKRVIQQAMEAAGPLVDSLSGDKTEIVDGLEGTATVAEVPVVDGYANSYVRPLALVVRVPGYQPYSVEPTVTFSRDKFPQKGQELPVIVDRQNPSRVKVLWDRVPTGVEAALAEARSPASQPAPAAGAGDTVSQLERLAQLHASGALSDEEFATLKARVLA